MDTTTPAQKEFDLNLNTARLLMDEPFFAAISRRIDKRASYAIPTAGVMVNPDTAQFEMLYNPKFFYGLTDLERSDVLKHEFYHIIFEFRIYFIAMSMSFHNFDIFIHFI